MLQGHHSCLCCTLCCTILEHMLLVGRKKKTNQNKPHQHRSCTLWSSESVADWFQKSPPVHPVRYWAAFRPLITTCFNPPLIKLALPVESDSPEPPPRPQKSSIWTPHPSFACTWLRPAKDKKTAGGWMTERGFFDASFYQGQTRCFRIISWQDGSFEDPTEGVTPVKTSALGWSRVARPRTPYQDREVGGEHSQPLPRGIRMDQDIPGILRPPVTVSRGAGFRCVCCAGYFGCLQMIRRGHGGNAP